MCRPRHAEYAEFFEATVDSMVAAHPKIRPIKVGLVAQYLVNVTFGLGSFEEVRKLLDEIKAAHGKACKLEQWTKQGGRYSESLHGWLARRGWEDVLPEPQKDDLEDMRAAADRYRQEKRAR